MYCTQCGSAVQQEQRFCTKCGAVLEAAELHYPNVSSPDEAHKAKPAKNRVAVGVFAAVAAVACVILAVVGVTAVSSPSSGEAEAQKTRLADYASVDNALGMVPSDLSHYTAESVAVLQDAIAQVDRSLTQDHQKDVDDTAQKIVEAVSSLKIEVPTNPTPATQEQTPAPAAPAATYSYEGWGVRISMPQSFAAKGLVWEGDEGNVYIKNANTGVVFGNIVWNNAITPNENTPYQHFVIGTIDRGSSAQPVELWINYLDNTGRVATIDPDASQTTDMALATLEIGASAEEIVSWIDLESGGAYRPAAISY